ncbi:MAG: hypothetical protein RIE52_03525 [Balneola sp.]
MESDTNISIAHPELKFDKVSLVEPSGHHFLLLAAEVDRSALPFFLFTSSKKKELLHFSKSVCHELELINGVISAVVFKAGLIPPGRGKLLEERPEVHIAKYDVVVLIEMENESIANNIRDNELYKDLENKISEAATHTLFLSASNVKKINSVDHNRQGVFLFNFFYADDVHQNIGIWEYTAGWFQQETGLDNSTVLLPENPGESDYKIINHCRWDSYSNILPSLIFKKTFKTYVLDNFYGNNVAAIPILYKLA